MLERVRREYNPWNFLEAKLKDAKDVIQTQENTIEWLDGKVKRLKEKKAKKEQND
jgi:hypothetical protein